MDRSVLSAISAMSVYACNCIFQTIRFRQTSTSYDLQKYTAGDEWLESEYIQNDLKLVIKLFYRINIQIREKYTIAKYTLIKENHNYWFVNCKFVFTRGSFGVQLLKLKRGPINKFAKTTWRFFFQRILPSTRKT